MCNGYKDVTQRCPKGYAAVAVLRRASRIVPTTETGDEKKGDEVVSERKAKLVGRVISVGGGALILAVFAYLVATGSPLAGPFLAGGAGFVLGYGLVYLAAGRIGPAPQGRLVRTIVLVLVVILAVTARSFVDLEYSAADSSLDLLADGFFFGVAFAAVIRIFTPSAADAR